MNKIIFVEKRQDTQRGVQLNDGRIISLFDQKGRFYLRFDQPLDLEKGVFLKEHVVGTTTTLNILIKEGMGKEVHCYDECDYNEDVYPDEFERTDEKVAEIKAFFARKGYTVEEDAINHQLSAWRCDMKSGYRDEKNGYHLFSPCGCNPLSIRLTTLHPLCDWQKTYER